MDNNCDFQLFPGVDLTLWVRLVLLVALVAVGAALAL
jgi:hypothetical protein